MCLISVCPKGSKKYSEKVTKFIMNGMATQDDGSGFMYKRAGENKITIDKGYFSASKLLDRLRALDLQDDDELIIHHRTGTSGVVCPENTHPYLMANDETLCAKTELTIDKPALAHNGVFYSLKDYENLNPNFCDSYAFARYVVGDKDLQNLMFNNPKLFDKIFDNMISNNKLAILHPEYGIVLKGHYHEDEEYRHSNYCYMNNNYSDYGGRSNYVTPIAAGGSCNVPVPSLVVASKGGNENLNLYFDKDDILINNSNSHHFYFIRKFMFNTFKANEMTYSKMKEYLFTLGIVNKDSLMQNMHKCTEKAEQSHAVLTTSIRNDFYYLPKEMYKKSYTDFMWLTVNYPDASKNQFKKLGKLVGKMYKKGSLDSIEYNRFDSYSTFTMLTLRLYLDFLTVNNHNKQLVIDAYNSSFSD